MNEVELVLAAENELGEGPLWNNAEQALYWVDIEAGNYQRYEPSTGHHQVINIGIKVGALAFRQSGGLVLATEKGLMFFDPPINELAPIRDPEASKANTRFNDGAVDRAGRFWAGTLGDPYNNNLYRMDTDWSIHRMETGLDISNGIGWSVDDRVMYLIDSTPKVIFAYDFDLVSGTVSNRRVFVDRSGKIGVPDGLIVDAEDFIWTAIWGGSCLERYDPQGQLVKVIPLPVTFPTSMAFGGSTLEDLYITSALVEIPLVERKPEAWDGGLLRIPNAGKGLPESLFTG